MNLNSILFPAPKSSYTIELLQGELIWVPKFRKDNTFSSINTDKRLGTPGKKFPITIEVEEVKDDLSSPEKNEYTAAPKLGNRQLLQNQQSLEFKNRNYFGKSDNENKNSILEDHGRQNRSAGDHNFAVNMHNELNESKTHLQGTQHSNGTHMHDKKAEHNTKTKSRPKKLLSIEITDSELIDSKRREDEDTVEGTFESHSIDEFADIKHLTSPKSIPTYSTKTFLNPNTPSTRFSFDPAAQVQTLPAESTSNKYVKPFSWSLTPGIRVYPTAQSKPYFLSPNQEMKAPQPLTSKNQTSNGKKQTNHTRGTSAVEIVESYIPCLLLQPEDPSDKIIIYFHGNGEDINLAYDLLAHVRNHLNVNVLAVEYPGYGLYKGTPNDATIMKDTEAVYDFFVKKLKVKHQNIVIFGRSIGSGPATYLASQREVGALILMSAFTSIRDVVKDFAGKWAQYLVKQRFNNLEMIAKVNCPIFLIHGQKDKLIPYTHSEELHRACKGASELLLPQLMDHIEFDFYEDFTLPLANFLERCNISLTQSSVGIYFPKIIFKTPELVLREIQTKQESFLRKTSE